MRLRVKEENVILRRAERTVAGVGKLSYWLCVERGRPGRPQEYGIGVCLRTAKGEESHYIPSVTADRVFATRIFRAILLGEVTPCTLEDVILDLLVEM